MVHMRILLTFVVMFCIGDLIAKESTIAVLATVKGEVLLFQVDRYLPVKSGKRVAEGDRLLIMENAQVHAIFDNDCEVTWDGARIVDVDEEQCPSLAALWIPCLGAAAGGEDESDIVLTQIEGSVLLLREGQYIVAEEGEVLEDEDKLKIDGKAEINYKGACSITHEGTKTIDVDKDSCPVAVLEEVDGKAFVDEGLGFKAAEEGIELKYGHEVKIPEESKVTISYYNGCDEEWEGFKIVKVNEESCPLAAPVPLTCSPAIFGIIPIITTIYPDDGPADPEPPVSP